jgi:FixJ family two-component response regulator
LVLAAARLPDGSWEDLVLMAAKAPAPINVIVVSEVVDIAFYLEALQVGAFDFIVPPMSFADFAYVVGSAVNNAVRRRGSRSLNAPRAKTVESEEGTDPAASNSETLLKTTS